MTYKEWLSEWLELYVKPLKHRTHERYKDICNLHIMSAGMSSVVFGIGMRMLTAHNAVKLADNAYIETVIITERCF